jgi:hypothetical protein
MATLVISVSVGLAISMHIWLTECPLVGLMQLGASRAASLARLDVISVATLTGFVALTLANVVQMQLAAEAGEVLARDRRE